MKIDSASMEKALLVVGGVAVGAAVGYAFREEIKRSLEELAEVDLLPVAQALIEGAKGGVGNAGRS